MTSLPTMGSSILVLGAQGMLGRYLYKYFSLEFPEAKVTGFGRQDFEASEEKFRKLDEWLERSPAPWVVINTIVERAMDKPLEMYRVNGLFPRLLGQYLLLKNPEVCFVQISSDSVMLSDSGADEKDDPYPINIYANSKLLGESSNYLSVRTSIIGEEYGREPRSLLGKLQKAAETGQIFPGFTNHLWNGVTCLELAKFLGKFISSSPRARGPVHLGCEPISKHDLCQLIGEVYQMDLRLEKAIGSHHAGNHILKSSVTVPGLREQLEELRTWSAAHLHPKVMVMVNSTITPACKSVFTPGERYQQLLGTIASIRLQLPGAEICLAEGSCLSPEQAEELSGKVTYLVSLFDHFQFNVMTYCGNPGVGELGQVYVAFDWLLENGKLEDKQLVLKLTGRYELTEEFNLAQLHPIDYTVIEGRETNPSRVAYAIPKERFLDYRAQLKESLLIVNKNLDLEECLSKLLTPRTIVNKLGISGQSACQGQQISL